tara:strand:- start:104 stop:685 length:582 start_codon:yes stop_codon:yes gene_type:complete
MKHMQIVFLALVAFLGTLPGISLAQENADNPSHLIEQSTQKVLQALEAQTGTGETVSVSALADELLSILETVVDFDSIARGVMGKYGRTASDAQIEEFATVFREIRVLDMPGDFDPATAEKASVGMQATTADGESFSLSYSMRRNAKGNWVVRNIVVDGINLGLTYMNQFDGAMSRHGSIDKVIAQWPEEMRE